MEMKKITAYKGKWWIPTFLAIAILLTIGMGFIYPARAELFFYGGEPNYSAVMLPNNSYVHQMENITQGNYYDLTGVYGFSGELAHWKDNDDAGINAPDVIIKLTHPESVFIDSTKFPTGKYYQWDGQTCDSDGACTNGFGHGNAYVFYVSAPLLSTQEKTIVHTSNITIYQNGSQIEIPVTYTEVQTYYGTPVPTASIGSSGTIIVPTPEETEQISDGIPVYDVQDQNGIPINGGVAGAVQVTARSPVPIAVPVFAILAVLITMRKRK
jgi:hypothetical protein